MNLNEYQNAALETASYPGIGDNLIYPAMGLAGEAGEFLDKVKKHWRNTGVMSISELTPEQKYAYVLELGDAMWYAAAAAKELGYTFDEVASLNIGKLRSRRERGVVKGEGDNR